MGVLYTITAGCVYLKACSFIASARQEKVREERKQGKRNEERVVSAHIMQSQCWVRIGRHRVCVRDIAVPVYLVDHAYIRVMKHE